MEYVFENNNKLPELILASASPRRLNIFYSMGLAPLVLIPDVDEITGGQPGEVVKVNSLLKVRGVQKQCPRDSIIIGADTIVVKNGRILGKPRDEKEAIDMLSYLSGNMHEVYSGIALLNNRDGQEVSGYSITRVYFRNTTEAEIKDYVRFADPLDKAGAYGIQDCGSLLVERIEGNYGTVMGFSTVLFADLMRKINYSVWQFIERDGLRMK